jgi:hypothetical protein
VETKTYPDWQAEQEFNVFEVQVEQPVEQAKRYKKGK